MLIPQISFNEVAVGVTPILPNVRNRIGIVGQFTRGPANVFAYINGFTEFSSIYGSDTAPGSVGLQAAWDQGARDFGVVRVLGRSQPACGEIIFGGIASKDNNMDLRITGIKEPFAALQSTFRMDITSNGVYTGAETGFYVFVVTTAAAGANPASVVTKFKFFPASSYPTRLDAIEAFTPAAQAAIVDNSNPGEGILVIPGVGGTDFDATPGGALATEAEEGINIVFGDAGDDLYFDVDQSFTVEVFSNNYNIPVRENDTAVELANNFVNTLQGVDPLGEVTSSIQYVTGTSGNYTSNVSFCFDNDQVTGSEGNNYSFFLDFDTPESTFVVECWYDSVSSTTELLSIDPDALLLELGDAITFPVESGLSGTLTVVSVTDPGGVIDDTNPYVITVSAAITGADIAFADRTPIYFTDVSATAPGFSADAYQLWTPMAGGVDGPRNAVRDIFSFGGAKLLQIVAISPGAWGNNLNFSIDVLGGTKWRLTVTDPDGQNFDPPIPSETYDIDLTAVDAVDDNGEVEATKTSNLIRLAFLPKLEDPTGFNTALLSELPSRLAPANAAIVDTEDIFHVGYFGPNRLQNVSLERGIDGPPITEADYVEAIKALDGTNTHIIMAPGVDTDSPLAQAQLITVAENSTEVDGLKIAILNTRRRLKPQAAAQETLAINSGRAVMVAGWATYAGQPGLERFSASPDAFYAGKLATIGYWVSPAARTTSGTIANIVEVDVENYTSNSSLQLYMDARLEVLRPNTQLGGFFFLNGITTDSLTNFDKVSIRRTYDVVRQDLYLGLQPYQSEPHTKLLRRQIETSINAYFNTMSRNGRIANALPAVCNDSNNPQENYINGNVNVSIGFLPLYAADYININITRNVNGGLLVS